jgi:hypothetical protein
LGHDQSGQFDHIIQGITITLLTLRNILFEGIEIPCAAIFKTFPTDRGMCCSFNMKAADEIFQEKSYSSFIQNLQDYDKGFSFQNTSLPDWYTLANEPKSQAGKKEQFLG